MPAKSKVDIAGKKFGMLTALYRVGDKDHNNRYYWHFKCDCGKECDKEKQSVVSGRTTSCGCKKWKHGDTGTRLYNIWVDMRMRCEDRGHKSQKVYGARGIKVCKEWQDYAAFKQWAISNGYEENLSIDRIDNDKGYFPENCRWATSAEQARNTRRNRYISINGESHLIREWCKILGIVSPCTVYRRVREYGWDYEKALTTPSMKYSEFSNQRVSEGLKDYFNSKKENMVETPSES